MSQEVVHVPLYLSQLRLAIVTGIKGQSKEKWSGYQQELDRAASYIEFDQEFGNPSKSRDQTLTKPCLNRKFCHQYLA
jgi:hypothetical protein